MAAAAKVAYARVSSQDQNLDRQLEAFKLIAPCYPHRVVIACPINVRVIKV